MLFELSISTGRFRVQKKRESLAIKLRSGTSVAANYRAVCRARSRAEFVAKIGIVVEEADETVFWFELLVEAGIVGKRKMQGLLLEGNELLAIFAASHFTAKKRNRRGSSSSLAGEPVHQ